MVKFIVTWCIAFACANGTHYKETYLTFEDGLDAKCFYESMMDKPCAQLDTVDAWGGFVNKNYPQIDSIHTTIADPPYGNLIYYIDSEELFKIYKDSLE